MQRGLYQSQVTSSLAVVQRPGHQADNCKIVYWDANVYRSLFKMLKMHVQVKLNSSMINTATEQKNYTAESLLACPVSGR